MLAIRMQRTGRKGHAMFRVIVQDSQRTPTSGKIVAQLGSYDPHAKTVALNKEKVSFYLEHGAQPSDRVALLLKKEGVKLPKWVKLADKREGGVRNPDKRRSTRPDEPVGEEASTTGADDAEATVASAEPAELVAPAEKVGPDTKAEETGQAQPEPTTPEKAPAEEGAEKPADEASTEEVASESAEKADDEETDTKASDDKAANKPAAK